MTGHAFIQHFIQKEEPLAPRVIAHAQSFQFRFSIQSSVYMQLKRNKPPLQSDRAQSDRLRCLHEAFSVRLSRQSDYKLIIWLHVNVTNESHWGLKQLRNTGLDQHE